MKFSQGKAGRIFIIRLEDGEVIHETLELFAIEHHISAATVSIVGAVDAGSKLVVGPEKRETMPPVPMERTLTEVYEMTGVGTIFPNENGAPVLHMHIACGRRDDVVAGCVRRGVRVWKTGEVVIREIVNTTARREVDPATGFELLNPRRSTVTDLSRNNNEL
ncbi:MAG: DNA-binding protein [Methanomassiliicoccales archaeon]|nr:DNA-binding protein [Methanomassiliicoccales archaeon]